MVFFSAFVGSYESLGQIEPRIRKAIFDTLFVYANVTTEMGWNKHPNISRFNRNLKLGLTQPYCSSYILYGYHQSGIYPPLVTAVAYSWRKKANLIFWPAMMNDKERVKRLLQQMDIVVFTWSHVEAYHDIDFARNEIITIAGNTRGGRKTEGVYFPVRRNIRYVLGIYNHITPYVKLHEEELKRRYSF
jgi:hypothetical protein